MANSSQKSIMRPDGWADVFVRTLIVLVIAFVSLNLKEWVETREWDVPACTIDAACVAAGTFLFYTILAVTSPRPRRTEDRRAVPATR